MPRVGAGVTNSVVGLKQRIMPCFRINAGLDCFVIFRMSVACFVVCGALFVGHMPADTDGPRFRLILPNQIVDRVSALRPVNVKWTRPAVLIHR